jgi:hypothetical protein
LAARHFRARPSPHCFTRFISLFAPCFSLLSRFFSLFRGRFGLENPLKTFCFQSVGQKAPMRAEQDRNREITGAYQGGNRQITGAEQVGPIRPDQAECGAVPPQLSVRNAANLLTLLDRIFKFDPAREG